MLFVWGLAALLLLPPGCCRVNRSLLRNAKVGDWVIHSTIVEVGGDAGARIAHTTKLTVKAKDDKNVTLVLEMESQGQKRPAQEVLVPLDRPYDFMDPAGGIEGAKVETLAQGEQTLEVGTRRYRCRWVEQRFTVSQEGMQSVTTSKAWVCRDVPWGGMVKWVASTDTKAGEQSTKMSYTMELIDAGSGP